MVPKRGKGRKALVVLPRVGRDIGEDRHLVDVGVVLGVHILQFRMEGLVAGAGQAGESLVDLDVGIADTEVGVVVVTRHPAWHFIGNLVGLGLESLALNETAQGFGVAEGFLESRGWADTGTEFLLEVASRGRCHLALALVIDILALVVIGEDGVQEAFGGKAFGSIPI